MNENGAQMSESYSPLDRLSSLLQWAHGFPHQTRFDARASKLRKNPSPFNRIQYCSQALLSGALPDAETLQFVAMAFNKYVCAAGALSLDEAFALKSKPKAGNPARQYTHNNKILGMLIDMASFRAHNPRLTLAKAAEWAQQGDESISVDTLVREYSRRGCKSWADTWRSK